MDREKSLKPSLTMRCLSNLFTCASSEARHKFRFAPGFFYLCRGLQPLDVILNILDSGYIRLFDITEKLSLASTVRTQ